MIPGTIPETNTSGIPDSIHGGISGIIHGSISGKKVPKRLPDVNAGGVACRIPEGRSDRNSEGILKNLSWNYWKN